LLDDRPWVIVPATPPDEVADARVATLATACGAKPIHLAADAHDEAVAAISHMPLVLSVALVESMASVPDWETASSLASGGWAGMTRLARGDTTMGAGILATNGPATAARLRDVRDAIDGWISGLAGGNADPAVLDARLQFARALAQDVLGRAGHVVTDGTESR
jgi:prephenate dehydrogenase